MDIEAYPSYNVFPSELAAVSWPRLPTVLLHGIGVLAQVLRPEGFTDSAAVCRRLGGRVFAPRIPPYGSIAERAGTWADRVRGVLTDTGAPAVNLVAFSAGGLDARYFVSRLGGSRRVASLTTVSSPHRGTSLAAVFSGLDRTGLHMASRALSGLAATRLGRPAGSAGGSIAELSPAGIAETFAQHVPDAPSVTYFSIGAAAGTRCSAPMRWYLRPQNVWLFRSEGPNDGFVSVESARWGTFLGVVGADHADLFGIPFRRSTFDATMFYASILHRLSDAGL